MKHIAVLALLLFTRLLVIEGVPPIIPKNADFGDIALLKKKFRAPEELLSGRSLKNWKLSELKKIIVGSILGIFEKL